MDNEKETILVVDDEKLNLLALIKMLSPFYAVSIAKTGKEALRLAIDAKPTMILLDILMPDMDGYETLQLLKSSPETEPIPVMFITGKMGKEAEERGFTMGAVDYIAKPFENAIVLARVKSHMQIIRLLRDKERLGNTDPMTGLPNRRLFEQRFDAEWVRALRGGWYVALIMIDVDNFKKYNDTYGHPQGDELLKAVAKAMSRNASRRGDSPCRFGGEEFIVLLPETDIHGAFIVAEKIRHDIANTVVPLLTTGEETRVTASLGVSAMIPTESDLKEDLLKDADERLYVAKSSGKNMVYPDVRRSEFI